MTTTTNPTDRKWNSTAGPIQTKRVNKAHSNLMWRGKSFTEITGIVGRPETESRATLTHPFGAPCQAAVDAANAIGEQFDYTVTRENAKAIVAAFEQATRELELPVIDKREEESVVAERQRVVEERHEQERQKQAVAESARDAILAKKPAGAHALIVAIHDEDKSDSMTDYFAHHETRKVAIGWRFSKREDFRALRRAAGTFEPTAHLEHADKSAEHRDNWSMGDGNYLKAGYRHATGWRVESIDLGYKHAFSSSQAIEDHLPEPAARTSDNNESTGAAGQSAHGVTFTTNDAKGGYELTFESKPSDAVRSFLKSNGFRWSRNQGLWYAKQSPARLAAVNQLLEGKHVN